MSMHTLKTVIIFLVPAYLTMVSLSTPDKEDDLSWMRYWVAISIFSLLEIPLDSLNVLPGYSTVKLVFILWCLVPGPCGGSELLFQQVWVLHRCPSFNHGSQLIKFNARYGPKLDNIINRRTLMSKSNI